jgi:hypothetical protein
MHSVFVEDSVYEVLPPSVSSYNGPYGKEKIAVPVVGLPLLNDGVTLRTPEL